MFRFIKRNINLYSIKKKNFTTAVDEGYKILPFESIPKLPSDAQNTSIEYFMKEGGFVKMAQTFQKQHQKFGPIFRYSFFPGGPDNVSVADPTAVSEIYRREAEGEVPARIISQGFAKYRDYRKLPQSLANTNDYEEWRVQRKIINETLFKPEVARTYVPRLDFIAKDFVSRVLGRNPETDPDYANNINRDITGVSLEFIGSIVFGKRLGAFTGEASIEIDEKQQRFIDAVNGIFTTSGTLLSYPENFPAEIFYELPAFKELVKHSDYMMEYAGDLIESKHKNKESKGGLFEFYLNKNEVSSELAKLMAIDIFGAGVDTTSRLVNWFLHALASGSNSIQERLREEVISIAGKEGPIDAKMLSKMKFLKDCLKEVHRVMPIVHANSRINLKDLNILGYNIPSGTPLFMSNYTMSRDSKLFKNPEEFNPFRWSKADKLDPSIPNKSFSSLPFGHGQRMCPGRRVAENEVQLLISNLIRNCEVYYPKGARHPEPVFNLFMICDINPDFRFKPV
ncbi:hypothetical protein HDU92_002882 [Lobulomyces angularis]|nr:hypothetical protein HDU92_002882 [Lobulomyces angularis]